MRMIMEKGSGLGCRWYRYRAHIYPHKQYTEDAGGSKGGSPQKDRDHPEPGKFAQDQICSTKEWWDARSLFLEGGKCLPLGTFQRILGLQIGTKSRVVLNSALNSPSSCHCLWSPGTQAQDTRPGTTTFFFFFRFYYWVFLCSLRCPGLAL